MAFAAFRIFDYANQQQTAGGAESGDNETAPNAIAPADSASRVLGAPPLAESNRELGLKILITSVIGSLLVKYGELLLDFPFDPQWYSPLLIITASTLALGGYYTVRSGKETDQNSFINSI